MMGMLGEDALGGALGLEGHPHGNPHLTGHLNAMRAAFAGMSSGRLPPHLLFSDRDFNEDDYEALLALDDSVENRKGACIGRHVITTSLFCDLLAPDAQCQSEHLVLTTTSVDSVHSTAEPVCFGVIHVSVVQCYLAIISIEC